MVNLIPGRRDDLDPARGVVNALAMSLASVVLGLLLWPLILVLGRWWS